MKNKTFIFLALLLISGITANSQDTGITFGLRGGVNMQNINGKDLTGDKLELNMVPRFNFGAVVGIPISPEFQFQTGVMYSAKGAKSKSDFLGLDMAAEYNISYIEMPFNFVYRPVLGNGHLLLGFGPYVAYGFGGKAKFSVNNTSTEEKIVYTNEYQNLNPFDWKYFRHMDYGGNLFFGFELNSGLLLQLNTQFGMAKINSDNTTFDNELEFRNTGYGLSLGFNF
jgi:hypothetical protein